MEKVKKEGNRNKKKVRDADIYLTVLFTPTLQYPLRVGTIAPVLQTTHGGTEKK